MKYYLFKFDPKVVKRFSISFINPLRAIRIFNYDSFYKWEYISFDIINFEIMIKLKGGN